MGQGKEFARPWLILLSAWLMGFGMYAPMFSVPPIMHIIQEELLLSHAQASLIFSVPIIMLATLSLPSGMFADRIGIRKAAGIGAIIIIIGSLLRGTSTSFTTLLAFTCLYGAGIGVVYPNLPKLVGTWFPRERMALATGIYATGLVTSSALSVAITLPVVFAITSTFQGVFYIWSIPATVAAIMWWIVVRDSPRSGLQGKQMAERNRVSYQVWRNKTLWLATVFFFLAQFYFFTWTGWAPRLMIMKGASPELAGLMSSVVLWLIIPVLLLAPGASDKAGLRKPFLWVPFIVMVFTALGAIYAPLSLGWPLMVTYGIACGTYFPIILALPPELVPAQSTGRASGMMMSIGYAGGLIGPLVAGHVLDLTGKLDLQFIVLIGVAIVGILLAFRLPETGTRARPLK